MELASQDQLALFGQLSRARSDPTRRPPAKEVVLRRANAKLVNPGTPEAAAHGKGHYCKCGQCRVCQQNAEWDAKFNQKFGESMKDYYSGMRLTRQASWWSEL